MNFNFTHQLLLGSAPLERRLLNYFCGCDLFTVALNKLIAFGKATLAQKLSLDILPVADLPILVLDPLLDDLRTLIRPS